MDRLDSVVSSGQVGKCALFGGQYFTRNMLAGAIFRIGEVEVSRGRGVHYRGDIAPLDIARIQAGYIPKSANPAAKPVTAGF